MLQKAPDKYSSLLEYRNENEVTNIPDSIEALLEEARSKQYDMPTLLRRMKSMVCFSILCGNWAHVSPVLLPLAYKTLCISLEINPLVPELIIESTL